jgi:hypothetical protein
LAILAGPKIAAVAVLATALLAPAAAHATVAIGSNLAQAPGGAPASEGCSPPCTFFQGTLAADRTAPGGLRSPVNGTITVWRIRAAGQSTPTALRVIRALSGGLYTGAGTSATVTPTLNSVSSFATSLPISIGDAIGIDCCQPAAQYFVGSGGDLAGGWNPILADGGPGRPNQESTSPHEIALNADIEPASTLGSVTAKPKHGGKLKVTVDAPNPGTLAASDKNVVKGTSIQVAAPGQAVLLIKPTNRTRSALRARGKLKAKVKLAYTPLGGSPTAQVVKAKLKP